MVLLWRRISDFRLTSGSLCKGAKQNVRSLQEEANPVFTSHSPPVAIPNVIPIITHPLKVNWQDVELFDSGNQGHIHLAEDVFEWAYKVASYLSMGGLRGTLSPTMAQHIRDDSDRWANVYADSTIRIETVSSMKDDPRSPWLSDFWHTLNIFYKGESVFSASRWSTTRPDRNGSFSAHEFFVGVWVDYLHRLYNDRDGIKKRVAAQEQQERIAKQQRLRSSV
ncbi:hypothetical protein BH11ARM2_BH11ARM2_09460 [soil metagenome]